MARRWPIAFAVLWLVAPSALPQDLAPEVLLLSRIKRHLREELTRIPNYTCLETISRFRYDPKSPLQSHDKGLAKLDTVRLEIVFTGGREWYGSPGERSLSTDKVSSFIAGGMIADGAFAYALHNVIEEAIFIYRGEEPLGGRTAVKYDFRLPALQKPLTISMPRGSGTVGEQGSMWVDPRSLDLIRLESHATEIPPYLPLQNSGMNVDYARMRIGDSDTLLAQQADSTMLDDAGEENFDRIEFTHCRSYAATSLVSFEPKPAESAEPASTVPVSAAPVQAVAAHAVPPFLEVTVRLTTPVSDKDSVGALIEGTTSGNVVQKRKVVVPDGSTIHGRIRRLEHYPDRQVFAVGLEFMDIEVRGESLPFYADLLRLDKDPRIQLQLSRRVLVSNATGVHPADEEITIPELPGVAAFFVQGTHLNLPAGFRLIWRTRGLIR